MTPPPSPPKFYWISKIPKQEHVSHHSEQLWFLGPPHLPPPTPHTIVKGIRDNTRFGLTYIWTGIFFISLSYSSSLHVNSLPHSSSLFSSLHQKNISSSHFSSLHPIKGIWDNIRFGFTYFLDQKIFSSLHLTLLPSSHSSSLHVNFLPHSSSVFSSLHQKTSLHPTFHLFIPKRNLR